MFKSIFLFIPAIFIVLLLTAISGQYQITKNPATSPTPTTVWQTYRNNQYSFEFQYSSEYSISRESEQTNQSSQFVVGLSKPRSKFPEITAEVTNIPNGSDFKKILFANTSFDGSGFSPKNIEEFTKIKIRDNYYYTIKTGQLEGVLSGVIFLVREKNIFKFSIRSFPVDWTSGELKLEDDPVYQDLTKILSTFKFLDPIPTQTTITSKVRLLDTIGWQQVKYKNISFKIPKDWVFNELGLTNNSPVFKDSKPLTTAGTPVILSPEDFGHPLVVREYNGDSPRQWYLDYLKETGETPQESSAKFQETTLGKVNALDVIIDNIYGFTPTLIPYGQTIVAIGYDSNNRDKRNPIIDTIISTIEFNN